MPIEQAAESSHHAGDSRTALHSLKASNDTSPREMVACLSREHCLICHNVSAE